MWMYMWIIWYILLVPVCSLKHAHLFSSAGSLQFFAYIHPHSGFIHNQYASINDQMGSQVFNGRVFSEIKQALIRSQAMGSLNGYSRLIINTISPSENLTCRLWCQAPQNVWLEFYFNCHITCLRVSLSLWITRSSTTACTAPAVMPQSLPLRVILM